MKSKQLKTRSKKRQALEMLQHKRLFEAKALYTEVCGADPRDAEAWFMLGIVNGMVGLFDESERCSRQAIAIKPNYAAAHANLGNALRALGRFDEAIRTLNQALRLEPDTADIHCSLGAAYFSTGRLDDARACFQSAIKRNPGFGDAYFNLGKVCEKQERLEEAAASYQKALALRPDLVEGYNSLGVICQRLGDTDKALGYFEQALRLRPDHIKARTNLANTCVEQERYDEAIAHYRRVINIRPDIAEGYRYLGRALDLKGDPGEAEKCFRQALQLEPESAEAFNMLGNALFGQDRFNEALEAFQRALQLKPDYAVACFNEGLAWREVGRLDNALNSFNMALAVDPELTSAHWDRALALLTLGEFDKGWAEYEWGFRNGERTMNHTSLPCWNGEPLDGKNVLVCAEQGIGDQIMFASCLPDLISRINHCVVECESRLVPLFERSFPGTSAIPRHGGNQLERTAVLSTLDVHVPLGSLPRYFRRDIRAFTAHDGFLKVDHDRRDNWRERFASVGEGLRIGVSWRGGSKGKEARQRSTLLSQWWEICSVTGTHFINVQYGDCRAELATAEQQGIKIHHYEESDPLKDMDDFAALLQALDLVISVDNATVHMAGALGVPVWTLLPYVADWRWLRDRSDSPWYPSMRLFRQPTLGDWNNVFVKAAKELRQLAE